MSFGAVQTNSTRTGSCPHGLPLGACPICSGGGGGTMRKADFSAKPGEMSWNECAAELSVYQLVWICCGGIHDGYMLCDAGPSALCECEATRHG